MEARKLVLVGALLLCLALVTGCLPGKPGASPLPTAAISPAALLGLVSANPAAYAGQQVTLQGVLESEGQTPSLRFFLTDEKGQRLETTTWAPLEVAQPPQGTAAAKSMAYYVGKRLLLTGTVAKSGDAYLLQVAEAEER